MKTSKDNSAVANQLPTKRGAASLYVVIFTTLLLSIITLSFIRIILSETTQTSNTDLAQSAYDSALAGVEDAKVAILRYHDCLSGRAVTNCNNIITAMQRGIENQSCDVVRDTLGRSANTSEGKQEVVIQESTTSSDAGRNNSSSLLQAYTCVKIAEELDDYRSSLNSDFRTRILPLRTRRINDVNYITVKWFSNINGSASTLNFMPNDGRYIFRSNTTKYSPPVISVQLIQAGTSFRPNEDFNVPYGNATNRAEAFLYPVWSGGTNTISADSFARTANKMVDDSGTGGNSNRLYKINCNGFNNGNEFACEARIYLPRPIGGTRSNNATFVRVDIPYGTPITDFAIQMYDAANNQIKFEGVQANVDSTGRANDLYRRVESRIELVDIYYPYPEFAIQSDGSGAGDIISKDFYSTWNCWYSDNGSASSCPNNSK